MMDARDPGFSDPRFYALRDAAYSDLQVAEQLVDADPSIIEARNSIGETAFHYLVVEDAQEPVEWLLKHGSNINTRNAFGATPLMEAAKLGYVAMCRFLLENGADVRLRDASGDTALAHAASYAETGEDRRELLRILLDQLDPNEDINPFFDEVTAYMLFKEGGPTTEMLKARGLVDPWAGSEPQE